MKTQTTKTPESKCPDCNYVFSAATYLDGDEIPQPGDMGICIGCQGIHVFTENMQCRKLTDDELLEVPLDVLSRHQKIITSIKGDI